MRRGVPLVVVALLASLCLVQPAQARDLPSEQRWRSDVGRAMSGGQAFLERRAATGGRLAVNLDVDNTMLATHYDPGAPVGPVLAFARRADRLGMRVFVNTARRSSKRARTARELKRAGYTVDGLCLRRKGEGVLESKRRCRTSFRQRGFTLVANVGNNPTDFRGGGYQRAFRLPNYGGRLS